MNYFIEYKYLTDLVLDEVVEIHHSAKFIDRILISTQPFGNVEELGDGFRLFRNILKIKFEISDYFDNCQENEIKDFFQLDQEPSREKIVNINSEKEDISESKSEEEIVTYIKRKKSLEKTKEIVEYLIHTLFFYSRNVRQHFTCKEVYTNIPVDRDISTEMSASLLVRYNLPDIKEEIEKDFIAKNTLKSINWNNPYYSTIHSIISNKEMDSIAKYMILYSLLAEICTEPTFNGSETGQQKNVERSDPAWTSENKNKL